MSRFGCSFLQGLSFADLLGHVQRIERAGFDSVWLADHLISYPNVGPMLEPQTTLAALAAQTSSVRVGTLVTNITYRNPVVLAKETITIDHISNGRAVLGIGAAGTRPGDAEIGGIPEWTTTERIERFAEFVEMLDGLLSGRVASYDGRYYRTAGFERGGWRSEKPPLMVAAHGTKTLSIAARFADEWNALAGWGRTGAEVYTALKEQNARLDELAADAGRDPRDIRRSALVGRVGVEWWSSSEAVRDLVGRVRDTGIEDVIFSYPSRSASDYATPEQILDVVAPALGLSS